MGEVLLTGRMLQSAEDALDEAFTVHRLRDAPDRDAFLAEHGERITAIASGNGADRALIEALPNLGAIAHFGVGYDPVDVVAAKERGVRVTNTPDVLNDAVAEMTLGLMLALCRRIPQADEYVRAGKWEQGSYPLTAELTGATVGVLGLGRIGQEVARRCQAMKMRVAYHGRTEQPYQPFEYYADLTEMARAADWLVVIVPGGGATKHLVNREVIEALGPEGSLVNVARGSVVDQDALVKALGDGTLGGAALDVFADEPQVPEALRDMDNVVLSPHAGSATRKTRWAMGDLVVRNLKAFMADEPLITPVV